MITTVGDRLAGIALAFAVLDIGPRPISGLVFAVRQGAEALVLVFGGVFSDRVPRNLVIGGASLLQGPAQAATAASSSPGAARSPRSWSARAVRRRWRARHPGRDRARAADRQPRAAAAGECPPGAEPQPHRHPRPCDRRGARRRGEPGLGARHRCAELLRLRGDPLPDQDRPPGRSEEREGFIHELREGWQAFTSRTWLWASVVLFGIGNLGPAPGHPRPGGREVGSRRCRRLGHDPRHRWRRCHSRQRDRDPGASQTPARRLHALRRAARRAGARARRGAVGVAALGRVVLRGCRHRRAPDALVHRLPAGDPGEMQSRVSSYDVLGSFVLMPIGFAS